MLDFEYKNVYRNTFIDRYKQLNIVKNHKVFLNGKKEIKFYIIKFDKNNIIRPKVYLLYCKIKYNYWQSIIVIINKKYIFFINDRI